MNTLGMFTSVSGKVCGHYEIGRRIGHGAMGDVYRALDIRLNRPAAIKVLPNWARGDPEARARFNTEAQAASALNHPNIVTVYEIFEHRGVDLLAMEYVQGETLRETIPSHGLNVKRALELAKEIVSAMTAAHTAGILHHDLKPGNVMITQDGHAKIVDFGLAEIFRAARKLEPGNTARPAGTRVYMAPEQIDGLRGDTRSEIFSFGLILHQMLTGRHPFHATDEAAIVDAISSGSPAPLPARIPRTVAQIVGRCIDKNPAKRYESMRSLLTDLNACPQGDVSSSRRAAPGPSPPREADALIRRIRYDNVPESRRALTDLGREIEAGLSGSSLQRVVSELRRLLTTLPDFGGNAVPSPVREIRRALLDTLRSTVKGELDRCFDVRDLEHLDLFGMNFRQCQLKELSFRHSFLVGSSFENAVLKSVSFGGASIRNVDFAGADLADADFTDADWFNALNLTADQLQVVRRNTLVRCPSTIGEMHSVLHDRYWFPFESWPSATQNQLISAWNKYLEPGGLRDVIILFGNPAP